MAKTLKRRKSEPKDSPQALLKAAGRALPDPANSPFSSIPEALEELKAGRMIILVDDKDRENEGDLVMPAETVTKEAIAFMAVKGRGLICLAMTEDDCDRLHLSLQTPSNSSKFGTAFTISIEAREGVTTGISAADRAHTIRTAIDPACKPEDLARPGHVFPLRARNGGVLVRAGQTEGSVDLCRMAGLKPAAAICEIMNDDGTMARLSQLELFSAEHKLKIAAIADLIEYRRAHERLVEHVVDVEMPTKYGAFRLHVYQSKVGDEHHLALAMGDIRPGEIQEEPVLVRVHSECLTGDAFASMRCDCGDQLHAAMAQIAKAGKGVVLYMRQEGRGIGLVNKLKAYKLQESGHDTVEANQALGFKPDLRKYGIGAQILFDLGLRKLKLLTNNPRKIVGLSSFGLDVVDRVKLQMKASAQNKRYLKTKKEKLGHLLEDI
ncbi:MAG: bifunctional 3,4-dihydroxy-2-butanone-4-phosphate synthase/GTP cyclohydrolase II [Planctomycetes bacterium]|nr:bifunctional 3,4-dihydroxy-2-butanone-4-phosphate synthase/GTP cyclohydrolase II [Planctomycetota bacterium]